MTKYLWEIRNVVHHVALYEEKATEILHGYHYVGNTREPLKELSAFMMSNFGIPIDGIQMIKTEDESFQSVKDITVYFDDIVIYEDMEEYKTFIINDMKKAGLALA